MPARGGSKGVPRKNLRQICGQSLICYAAQTIAALDWLDCALLSTDDDEMAVEAERYGLSAPFRRPATLSSDSATSVAMWQHAWRKAESWSGLHFDVSILLEPTSPMRRPDDIAKIMETLSETRTRSAATVSPTPAHFTPEKMLCLDERDLVRPYLNRRTSRRQEIPPYYHVNGVCYAVTRSELLQGGTIIGANCAAVIIDRPLVNIDDEFDLELAEYLMKKAGR